MGGWRMLMQNVEEDLGGEDGEGGEVEGLKGGRAGY